MKARIPPAGSTLQSAPAQPLRVAGESSLPNRGSGPEGQPLEPSVREGLQARFGADFSAVRVHDDRTSHRSAHALGARAFTVRQDIYFAEGQFAPWSATGRRLLAHELAHTIQQRDPRPETAGLEGIREAEADRASRQVESGTPVHALTPLGVGLARQPVANSADAKAEIFQIIQQLKIPILPPWMRLQLEARLHSLMQATGGPALTQARRPTATDTKLAGHIDDHPGWTVLGGKGTQEGYAEIEANTGTDAFERSSLFIAWYLLGWDGIRARPDPAKDLKSLASHLMPVPTVRQVFLASVNLGQATTATPAAPPRSLSGSLDLSRMSAEEKRTELDAIRVWKRRDDLGKDAQKRLSDALVTLVADMDNTRGLEEASTKASPAKKENRTLGVGPGTSVASGPYGDVSIDWMKKGRPLDGESSPHPSFSRYMYNGVEISPSEATKVARSKKRISTDVLEPSIGAADRFVVLPQRWGFSDGTYLDFESWVLQDDKLDSGQKERWRRVIINNHRAGPLPPYDGDGGLGNFGRMPAGPRSSIKGFTPRPSGPKPTGVRSGARPEGDSAFTSVTGPAPKLTKPAPQAPSVAPSKRSDVGESTHPDTARLKPPATKTLPPSTGSAAKGATTASPVKQQTQTTLGAPPPKAAPKPVTADATTTAPAKATAPPAPAAPPGKNTVLAQQQAADARESVHVARAQVKQAQETVRKAELDSGAAKNLSAQSGSKSGRDQALTEARGNLDKARSELAQRQEVARKAEAHADAVERGAKRVAALDKERAEIQGQIDAIYRQNKGIKPPLRSPDGQRLGKLTERQQANSRELKDAVVRLQTKRDPLDVAVNPKAPPPKATGTIGKTQAQNQELQRDLQRARALGATDLRVNQEQVNADGIRVGVNKPDLQFTLPDASLPGGKRRYYIEYDRTTSARGPVHKARIESNDPNGTVYLKTID
jgi:hypothetical protein